MNGVTTRLGAFAIASVLVLSSATVAQSANSLRTAFALAKGVDTSNKPEPTPKPDASGKPPVRDPNKPSFGNAKPMCQMCHTTIPMAAAKQFEKERQAGTLSFHYVHPEATNGHYDNLNSKYLAAEKRFSTMNQKQQSDMLGSLANAISRWDANAIGGLIR